MKPDRGFRQWSNNIIVFSMVLKIILKHVDVRVNVGVYRIFVFSTTIILTCPL